jgi:predicted MFS family arabinose efflux permease
MTRRPGYVLPIIVAAQAMCTTLWFGGNAVLPELTVALNLPASSAGFMVSSVQLGFIAGTLLFAILALADKMAAVNLFFGCAIAAALVNAAIMAGPGFGLLLTLRFFTGFLLAGIYPVGMKIAADQFPQGLGKALGFLVGALVLGSSFPHLLRGLSIKLSWQAVLLTVSCLAMLGGTMLRLALPPLHSKKGEVRLSHRMSPQHAFAAFKDRNFRLAAFGYFGHMWELYAFWAFLPFYISHKKDFAIGTSVSLFAFATIAAGTAGCAITGILSKRISPQSLAHLALAGSFICCLVSPIAPVFPQPVFLLYLIFWGTVAAADSPMFSTLVAQTAPASERGTALTIVTSIGFAITVISIELLNRVQDSIPASCIFLFLFPGPLLGLLALRQRRAHKKTLA